MRPAARQSLILEAISAFARVFQKAATREFRSNDARLRKPTSMRNGSQFPPTLCSWPSARNRVRHIPSAPSYRERQRAPDRQLRYGECLPADRSPQDRVAHLRICEARRASRPIRLVAPLECADPASPHRKRNVPETIPWQTQAPVALLKATPRL